MLKLGHVTRATPTYGSFWGSYAGRVSPPSLYPIWSGQVNSFKSYKGSQNFEIGSREPGQAHLGAKRFVDKMSKSTYPSLAPITVFVISGLQSVIYTERIFTMCDEFLMGCTLLTAFVHLCVLFSGIQWLY